MAFHRTLFSGFALACALLLNLPADAAAQVGKLTGVVVDASTGEPLAGAHVFIEGTGRGTLTAENGRYFIVNVPVATYGVVAELIGYARARREGVLVTIDETKVVNFELQPQAVAVEEITVVAERTPLVQLSATGSSNLVTSADIQALPVINIEQALSIQQGFLKIPDQTTLVSFTESRRNPITPIRIRGGRGAETSMLIDGVPVNNFLFGSPALSITPEAIEQIDFVRGGFPPQYGNALSGILNIATKEGGTDLRGAVRYHTSQFGAALGNTRDEVADFDLFEGYLAGPVPGTEFGADNPRLRFMVAGRQKNGADRALEFDDLVFDPSERPTADIYPFLGPNFMDVWAGWRGLNFDRERDVFGKLTYYFTPTAKLNFAFIDFERNRQPFDFTFLPTYGNPLDSPIIDSLEDSVAVAANRFASRIAPLQFTRVAQGAIRQERRLWVLKWDHTVGRTFYNVVGGRFDQSRLTCNYWQGVCLEDSFGDPNFTDDQFIGPLDGTCAIHPTCGTDFFFGGEDLKTWVFRGDIQSQVTDHHNLQAGGYYETHDVSMNEVQNVGVNLVNRYRLRYAARPWNAAFYVQDQIEYDFITLNLGFRFDLGRAGGLFLANPLDPTNGSTATSVAGVGAATKDGPCVDPSAWQGVRVRRFNGERTVEEVLSADAGWTQEFCLQNLDALNLASLIATADDFDEAGTRTQFSPRIGVSFPVTANSSLFFNFGRYSQNPLLNNVYVNTGIGKDTTVAGVTSSLEGTPTGVTLFVPGEGGPGIIGNPKLLTEQTTSYEVGYLAELFENYALSVVLFSKDQLGLTGIRTGGISNGVQVFDPGVLYGSNTPNYQILVNADYQTVRGFEISLRRRVADYWGFQLNYAFARAFSNASPPEKEFERQIFQGDPNLLIEQPSEIDQPQKFVAALYFQVGNEAPEIPLGQALRNADLTIVSSLESGFPYTPTLDVFGFGTSKLSRNTGRGPSVWSVDLQASKSFPVGHLNVEAYVQIQNLFDRKNCLQVFTTTGECTVGSIDQSRRREGNPVSADQITRTMLDHPEFFGERRAIFGGLRLSF